MLSALLPVAVHRRDAGRAWSRPLSVVHTVGENHAVLEQACVSHFDASVLTFGTQAAQRHPSAPPRNQGGSYCPEIAYPGLFHARMYRERPTRRHVAIHNVPASLAHTFTDVRWRDDVDGAAILGAYSMGTGGTVPETRPGYDQWGNIWHGAFEALGDAWPHVSEQAQAKRRGEQHLGQGAQEPRCPRYDVLLTDEVLGPRSTWSDGFLLSFWRALAASEDSIRSIRDVFNGSRVRRTCDGPADATTGDKLGYDEAWAQRAAHPLTCYRQVLVGAPLKNPGKPTLAWGFNQPSPLRGMGDCMLQKYGLPARPLVPRDMPRRKLRVTVINRLECDRAWTNPDDVLTYLRGRGLKPQLVGFEKLSRAEQVATAATTDLMVTPHGAAEAWMLLMPRGSAILELKHLANGTSLAGFARGFDPDTKLTIPALWDFNAFRQMERWPGAAVRITFAPAWTSFDSKCRTPGHNWREYRNQVLFDGEAASPYLEAALAHLGNDTYSGWDREYARAKGRKCMRPWLEADGQGCV